MRLTHNPQRQLGQIDIASITFNARSRDELPQVLKGLQYIYTNEPVRDAVFACLEKHIAVKQSKTNGRPGMELWNILVIGVLRLDLNWDYDRLEDEVNNHQKIRQMLGHSDFGDETVYALQTLKDNVSLLTPELLDEINQIVVEAGQAAVKKKDVSEVLRGRCDSFVVKTNVHYPTDINLLWDALRKMLQGIASLCDNLTVEGYRQSKHTLRQLKKALRECQQKKRSKAKTDTKKAAQAEAIITAHQTYIDAANVQINKVQNTLANLREEGLLTNITQVCAAATIDGWIEHAVRQINQTERRVIMGEIIPQNEKVFSIFEPHTEWVCKGKAGVPVELGLKVCIVEDQHQFILHHRVMEHKMDSDIAVSIVCEAKERFTRLNLVSFDKGFHSPDNHIGLGELLAMVVLPRKGKLSKANQAIESSDEFRRTRHQHSAVESAINALQVHGLDRCPDKGLHAFKRYISLAVLARNFQTLGVIIIKQEKQRKERQQRYFARDGLNKLVV